MSLYAHPLIIVAEQRWRHEQLSGSTLAGSPRASRRRRRTRGHGWRALVRRRRSATTEPHPV